MDRKDIIRKSLTQSEYGIEIAPYFSPLTPKRDGYRCLTLDVFDQEELRTRALNDPNIPDADIPLIEHVDFVGSAAEIEKLVGESQSLGSFDYVISSHNFEHLPDPIKFLQGCSNVLKPGGRLIMAIPDKRVCFDYFRPESTFSDWLDAYTAQRSKPNNAQVFRAKSMQSILYVQPGIGVGGFHLHDDPSNMELMGDLTAAFEDWEHNSDGPADAYHDAHCWTFTPSSFELLIREGAYLGFISMSIASISGPNGHEFYVELINQPWDQKAGGASGFQRMRRDLLLKIRDELAENTPLLFRERAELFRERAKIAELQAKIDLVRQRPLLSAWRSLTGKF